VVKAMVFLATVWVAWWKYGKEKEKDRQERTKASTEKLHQLFSSFYLSTDFDELRIWLDYDPDYQKLIEPALEKVLSKNPELKPDDAEKIRLCKLDKVLNYFEFILHLEKKGQLAKDDRDAIFEYWLELIKKPKRDALRRYIREYGYKALSQFIATSC
jgi:hypothetical protein